MAYVVYAKTPAHTVWRDTRTHNGYIQNNATGEQSLQFVCMEGAAQLAAARRLRMRSPALFDKWCRDTLIMDNPEAH
jgi:hypothetical protein